MGKLILKKDWKDLTVMEWEGILEDVSEASTKFKYQTFTVKGERVYELIMKKDGKNCGRWAGNKLIASEDQFCVKNAIINAAGIMIINYQCKLEGEIVDKVLWLGAKYLSMSDALLKKKSKQKQNVYTWEH